MAIDLAVGNTCDSDYQLEVAPNSCRPVFRNTGKDRFAPVSAAPLSLRLHRHANYPWSTRHAITGHDR